MHGIYYEIPGGLPEGEKIPDPKTWEITEAHLPWLEAILKLSGVDLSQPDIKLAFATVKPIPPIY